MNEYQKHNIEMINSASEKTMNELREGYWRNTFARIMKCVVCGENKITTPIMKYYNWQGERMKCYKCQYE